MLDIMTEEARIRGAEVEVIPIRKLQVHPCTGCMACRSRQACVLPEDDAKRTLQKIQWADVLIVGSPCYWGNMNGHLKVVFDRIVYADEVNWIAIPALTGPLRVTARTRYHQAEQQAIVYPAENGFRLEFDQPQRAPTPGQAAVLYQGDVVLGGGIITRVEK